MKIAMVVLRFDAPGGVETTARLLVDGYRERGHEVEIFASDLYDEASWDRRKFPPSYHGMPVHRFDVYKRLLPHVTFVTMPKLMSALVAAKPDVIEAHSHRYGQVLQCAAVSLATGIPLVIGTHYHPADIRASGVKRGILRVQDHAFGMTAYRVARFLVVETETEARQLREFSPAEKVRIVPPGLEIDDWFADEPPLEGDPYVAQLPPQKFLLYAGRIAENKGIDFLLEAYARIPKSDRWPLVLMGKDWGQGPALTARAERLGVARELTWLGHVPSRRTYREVFRRASGFVLPSEYEAFGFVLMEAMATGLPIVATSVGAVAEVLEQGGIGELVKFGDVRGLTGALTRMVRDPAGWSSRIARGRIRARDFTVAQMVEGHLALYREALA